MMAHSGYLVIADITGYTAFLNQSELEHAKDSLNRLLTLLIEYTRRPLLISRLEGDAVISYALDGTVIHGQTVVELIENTFVAFRKARELMIVNTTCPCRACKNIPNLDLKFFAHHGTYSFQELGDHKELLGNDVNLIHRLTKNSVTEKTGLRAYALYTAAAIEALKIAGFSDGMKPHREAYEHIGEVRAFVQDLNGVWKREREQLRFEIRPQDTLLRKDALFPLPATQLWDYLTRPEYRAIIHGSEWQKIVSGEEVRIGRDVVYECSHGTFISRNTIVDWHPFEQYTTHETSPIPRTFHYVTYILTPEDGGTRVTYAFSKARGPFPFRQIGNFGAGRVIGPRMDRSFEAFRDFIEEEIKRAPADLRQTPPISAAEIEAAVTESLPAEES
jgi:hypothetical protein